MKAHLLLMLVGACVVRAHETVRLELRSWARSEVKELMKRDLLGDATTHSYTEDRYLHVELLRELVEEHLTPTTANLVLNFVGRQPEDFLFAGYVKALQVIEVNSLGDATLFQLASRISRDRYRGHVMALLATLPEAVWTVFSAKTACVRNRGYGEYLYAGAGDLKYDNERRRIFTWRPGFEAGKPGDWRFEHVENNLFHVVNAAFGERLYAEGDAFNYDTERRRVLTWAGAGAAPNQADVWALELDGEDVFLRNVHFDEYLYALDGHEYDSKRRRVPAWIPKGRQNCDSDSYQCRWMVTVC